MAQDDGSTIVTGDWVLPITSPPIPNGGVLVGGDRIVAVGRGVELTSLHPSAHHIDLPGRVLTPGLVNAHTHLGLTILEDLLPPADFAQWLARMPVAVGALDASGLKASASEGARRCIAAGVTCIGDIAHGPEAIAAAAEAGLGGVIYWEVLGVRAEQLDDVLATSGFPGSAADPTCTPRVRCGISPHAPYTSGPALLQAAYAAGLTRFSGRLAIHVAESPAESIFVASGTGPLASLAARLAPDFTAQRSSPVAYLASLGVLDGALAIHCVHIDASDAAVLADHARGVVVCPRSNEYLRAGVAPLSRLRAAGVTIAIGTDSLASNVDLDLFEELRALRTQHADVSPAEALAMITHDAARALGVDDMFGAFEAGMAADLVAWNVSTADEPVSDLIEHAGTETLDAVMTAGQWRFRDGRPVHIDLESWPAYERSRSAARAVLDTMESG